MKNNTINIKRLAITIPVIALVVFLIIILIINLIPTDANRVAILNPEEIQSISGDMQKNIKIQLIKLLQEQNLITEKDTVNDVKIREGSFANITKLTDSGNVKTSSFLIDIDSLHQTYRITAYEATNQVLPDLAVQITCPKTDEIVYSDSKCVGTYETGASVSHNIPYTANLPSGEKYIIKSITSTNKGEHILQIYLYSCDSKDIPTAETEEIVRQWVTDLGDDVDYYTYNVRTGYCEGDAI